VKSFKLEQAGANKENEEGQLPEKLIPKISQDIL